MIVVQIKCKMMDKSIHTVYTRELNWLQNNAIFLDSIVNLERNK
jgi:hypothetical protein